MKEIYHLDANILQVRPDLFSDNLWVIKGDLSSQKVIALKIPEGKLSECAEIAEIPVGLMLKEVLSGVLIFSELKDPASSDSNRIYCIDSATGNVIYDERGWYFDRTIDRSNFIVKRPLKDSIESKTLELDDLPFLSTFSSDLMSPNIINASNMMHKDILVLFETISENIKGAIEILENRNLILASFHTMVGKKMFKLLAVINEKGQLVQKFEIATELEKYLDESFFVWGNFMIFVQEKKKLRFINLDTILT
jgi:hypothetical protein